MPLFRLMPCQPDRGYDHPPQTVDIRRRHHRRARHTARINLKRRFADAIVFQ
ncbi:hypothetical protein [Allorhizocola rhizosphaerae]|uniref:hypothetical protein n=1 Tax=Allorhizocola rhizosphaerae TaxID=1872709 RepID=UPI0013C2FA86|nr:hypothetical protein [Allorhizocola rhizosphaerae]